MGRRFLPLLAGPPGVADYVLRASPLPRFVAELRRRGVALTGPVPMSRERRDGTRTQWDLALPADHRYPMLIEDRTPRALRVPEGPAAIAHPNGARGVAAVRVRVASVPAAALEYADLFGGHPEARRGGGARVTCEGFDVVLEAGEPEGAAGVAITGAGSLSEAVLALGVTT